jgi:hypothetical protein
MSKRKPGDIFICMEHSEPRAEANSGYFLGVFQPKEYLVVTANGYICIETPEDSAPSDISDKDNRFHTYESAAWEAHFRAGRFSEIPEDENDMFIIPVSFEFIRANAPRYVQGMIYSALAALGKIKDGIPP